MRMNTINTGDLLALKSTSGPVPVVAVGPLPVKRIESSVAPEIQHSPRGRSVLVAVLSTKRHPTLADLTKFAEHYRQNLTNIFDRLKGEGSVFSYDLPLLFLGNVEVTSWKVVAISQLTGDYAAACDDYQEQQDKRERRYQQMIDNRQRNETRLDAVMSALRARGLGRPYMQFTTGTETDAEPQVALPLSVLEALLGANLA
jgi:hypothetical protein